MKSKIALGVIVIAMTVLAVDVVNNRPIPTKQDNSTSGEAMSWGLVDTLFSEIVAILPNTRNADAIDVDSIRGNPDVDSISGHPIIDSATVAYGAFTDIKIDAEVIDSLSENAGQDSIIIKIGTNYYAIPAR